MNRTRRTVTALGAALFVALAVPAVPLDSSAATLEDKAREIGRTAVLPWIQDAVIVEGIERQNTLHQALSQAEIDALDLQWRRELRRGHGTRPLIDQVLSSSVSAFLKARHEELTGTVTELFVMDDRGLLVGLSRVTSDYWQGDEDKWTKTFLQEGDEMHVGKVEKGESTQTYQIQVSFPILDPTSRRHIGAITAGINVERLVTARKE